jgi:uncharacterized protein YunC (DUF1805 family)
MDQEEIPLRNSTGTGYVLPLGPVNLVWVVAAHGLLGCGAIDVAALGKFGYPAARVRPTGSDSIATLADLLSGMVKEVNPAAECLGVRTGMEGKEALDLLS